MDFLQFIPSKTVADYVRKTGYKLTTVDAVCIVRDSVLPLKSKHEAHREIISIMPDCKLGNSTLHTRLSQLMKQQEQVIALFEKNDASTYFCQTKNRQESKIFVRQCGDSYRHYHGFSDKTFLKLQDCLETLRAFPKDQLEVGCKISIRKQYNFMSKASYIEAEYNHNLRLVSIHPYQLDGSLEEEYEKLLDALDDLDLNPNFPFPFSSGDLICDCTGSKYISTSRELEHHDWGVKVLQIRETKGKKQYGFYSPYYIYSCLNFIKCFSSYQKLRYEIVDEKALPAKYYLVIAVSAFLKGKIDLEQFLRIYDYSQAKLSCNKLSSNLKKNLRKFGIRIR